MPQDYRLAVEYFRKAAEQGGVLGQFMLGVMYQEGQGVPKNYVYAYMWMDIASDGFTEEVGRVLKERVGVLMTPSQIQKAKELARACIRKQYKDCEV